VGAALLGVNLFEGEDGAFILSSFLAGIAGALFASYTRYVTPAYWDLTLSIQFVAAIIVGALPVSGAQYWGQLLVFGLPLVIDHFALLPPASDGTGGLTSGDLNALIYGALLLCSALRPGG